MQFLFLIKPTKKFSFEPKLKDQKIELVCESSFYIIGKNELWIIYDTSWNEGHIQGKETMKYMRKINFSKKNQNPITCM